MAAASLKTEMTPSSHVFPDRDLSEVNILLAVKRKLDLKTMNVPFMVVSCFF